MLLLILACTSAADDSGNKPQPDGVDSDSATDTGGTTDTGELTTPASPELWVYLSHNLLVDDKVVEVEGLMDRAAAAGYSGVVLSDFKLNLLDTPYENENYRGNVQEVLAHAAGLGLKVLPGVLPFGYSEGIYYGHPDLAEGAEVSGATFTVDSGGRSLSLVPEDIGFADGGLETHSGDTFSAWDWQDEAGARTFADTSVHHGGSVSARIDAGGNNARIVQGVTLKPHRQYHLEYWIKTQGFSGDYTAVSLLDATTGAARNFQYTTVAATQDWTKYEATFTAMDTTAANLYVGNWGNASGTIWFDDIQLTETGLVNLIRRDGAPLTLTHAGTPLTEGVDFDAVADPQIAVGFDNGHTPPTITLPAGTALRPGDAVEGSFYVVSVIYDYQVGACLTEPAIDAWMETNIAAVDALFPTADGYFLEYDEMRQVGTCGSCAATGLLPGELIAAHVAQSADLIRSLRPGVPIYYWSDMFDPNHNAVVGPYYDVAGDLTGSWAGLPGDAVIMNWNLGNADSLAWFASKGHPQIIAGYYDSGDGKGSATAELAAAVDVPGVQGLMYTTWAEDFSQLEAYAEGARAAWP